MAVLDYRETKTYVIRVEEQLSQMLDDHIAMTQSMGFRCGQQAPAATPTLHYRSHCVPWWWWRRSSHLDDPVSVTGVVFANVALNALTPPSLKHILSLTAARTRSRSRTASTSGTSSSAWCVPWGGQAYVAVP